ncbi:MAG: response regulator [Candidatus Omnitrophota bacterium]
MPFKILIVDDEKDIVDFVQNRLLRENYDVVTARDGEEALLKVKVDNPDVILLDLIMPKLNGFEVLKAVREQFNDKWRPVIIVSANDELETLKKCYGLEADHYLAKPCTMEALLNGIQTMISLIPLRIK